MKNERFTYLHFFFKPVNSKMILSLQRQSLVRWQIPELRLFLPSCFPPHVHMRRGTVSPYHHHSPSLAWAVVLFSAQNEPGSFHAQGVQRFISTALGVDPGFTYCMLVRPWSEDQATDFIAWASVFLITALK